jgi:hypothetical protein
MQIAQKIRPCLWVLFIAVFAASGWASDDTELERASGQALKTQLGVERLEYADIDGSDASFARTRYSAGLRWKILLLEVEHDEYDWRDGAQYSGRQGAKPWDSLTAIAPGLQYYHVMESGWSLWAKFKAIAGFEDSVRSKSWTYNPQLIGFYPFNERFTLYGGVGMLYHPVDTIVYPVIGVNWNKDASTGFSGAIGIPETMVRYRFNSYLAARLDFEFDLGIYSLEKDNALAEQGFIKNEDMILGLHLEYEPVDQLRISLGLRRFFGRSFTVYDRQENELRSDDVDQAWSIIGGVSYWF